MRFPAWALAAVCLLGGWTAHADEKWLGRITSTGSSVNASTTAVPFYPLPTGSNELIQCDAAVFWLWGTGTSATVSSTAGATKGPQLAAFQFWPDTLQGSTNNLAIISVSGTANCDVWQVTP